MLVVGGQADPLAEPQHDERPGDTADDERQRHRRPGRAVAGSDREPVAEDAGQQARDHGDPAEPDVRAEERAGLRVGHLGGPRADFLQQRPRGGLAPDQAADEPDQGTAHEHGHDPRDRRAGRQARLAQAARTGYLRHLWHHRHRRHPTSPSLKVIVRGNARGTGIALALGGFRCRSGGQSMAASRCLGGHNASRHHYLDRGRPGHRGRRGGRDEHAHAAQDGRAKPGRPGVRPPGGRSRPAQGEGRVRQAPPARGRAGHHAVRRRAPRRLQQAVGRRAGAVRRQPGQGRQRGRRRWSARSRPTAGTR